MRSPVTDEQIQQFRAFDTCVIADAIESFGIRLRNEGIATGGFRCLFKNLSPMVGYAASCKVRSTDPPTVGSRYVERIDWWQHIFGIPSPTVVVMQDIDDRPGTGALFDKVHANVFAALGCVGQ
jgi:4-hydroxy-4-methyl-2-oxoglutarate aldolase